MRWRHACESAVAVPAAGGLLVGARLAGHRRDDLLAGAGAGAGLLAPGRVDQAAHRGDAAEEARARPPGLAARRPARPSTVAMRYRRAEWPGRTPRPAAPTTCRPWPIRPDPPRPGVAGLPTRANSPGCPGRHLAGYVAGHGRAVGNASPYRPPNRGVIPEAVNRGPLMTRAQFPMFWVNALRPVRNGAEQAAQPGIQPRWVERPRREVLQHVGHGVERRLRRALPRSAAWLTEAAWIAVPVGLVVCCGAVNGVSWSPPPRRRRSRTSPRRPGPTSRRTAPRWP